jgi:hypothetical protein
MGTERSDVAYGYWREANEKFDYLVTGVSGALTAYIGQNIHAARLGANPQTVEVLALSLLVASLVCAFRRIEATVHLYRLQTQQLYAQEARGSSLSATQPGGLTINQATGNIYTPQQLVQRAAEFEAAGKKLEPLINDLVSRVTRLYHWRNRFLFSGFATLIVARLLPAYLSR